MIGPTTTGFLPTMGAGSVTGTAFFGSSFGCEERGFARLFRSRLIKSSSDFGASSFAAARETVRFGAEGITGVVVAALRFGGAAGTTGVAGEVAADL